MKLYDFMKISQCDYDTYDTVYDACVTVCFPYEEEDSSNEFEAYDKFCNEIMKKVEVIKQEGDGLIVDWNKLITDNTEKFKEFTRKYWIYDYEDDEDEFIYQWINEIHYYLAGYTTESIYKELVKLVETLEA